MKIDTIKVNVDIVADGAITSTTKIIEDALTYSPLKINIASLYIEEDVEYMTDIARFKIPESKAFLTTSGLFFITEDGNYYFFRKNSKIRIFISLNNFKKRMLFSGYIESFTLTQDGYVEVNCDNDIRFLKISPKIKTSFPDTIRTVGKNPDYDVFRNSTYAGENFQLKHLIYWILSESENRWNTIYDTDYRTELPFDNIYVIDELRMDKLVIDDELTPSVILDKLNDSDSYYFRTFIRYEDWIEEDEAIYPQKNLYIGWLNWFGKTGLNIKTEWLNNKQTIPVNFDNDYHLHKFSYPYQDDRNPILQHNFQFVYTKKEDLVVIVTTTDKNGITSTYFYPNDSLESKKLQARQKADDLKLNDAAYKAQLEAESKDVIRLRETESNTIKIDIPLLDEKSALEIAKHRYDTYKDNGASGEFLTIGEPYIQKGDVIDLQIKSTPASPEFEQYYFYVNRVERIIDNDGMYMQRIFLGNRLNSELITEYDI